jgi:hypothetical protein
MFDHQLFLGLPLSESYQQELAQLPAPIRAAFIQSQSSLYLQQIENEGTIYLGKSLGPLVELSALESIQAHIYSLLKKLVPHYSYDKHPLLLFALCFPPSPAPG